ncbi:MAG TPA: c-type cytochrome biogenesis protein CcmI [Gammaproteobacteria bacterium]|nr:c-type cytochrome biogenesis protein CcmI [Gammaproteobacteria bacterium]
MSMYIWFTLMASLSAVWLIWFLYRPLQGNDLNLQKSNIALGKQRQAELQRDLERDLIDESSFDQAHDEITQTLAIELNQTTSSPYTGSNNKKNHGSSVFVLIFLMVFSFAAYDALSPEKNEKTDSLEQQVASLTLDESLIKLKDHLDKNPDDAKSWQILGLTYFELDNLNDSLKAYEMSHQLDSNNVRTLVEYATTLARLKEGSFTGKPTELVEKALAINPNSIDAIYLIGLIAANQQDFATAEKQWKQALMLLSLTDPNRQAMQEMLEQVQSMGAPQSQNGLMVDVTIPEQLMRERSKDDYLMVYAKAATGMPMPISIVKIRLKDFTGRVILSDDNSVMPSRLLSQAKKIIVVARISQTGNAMKQSGDVDFASDPFELKGTSRILLDMTPEPEVGEEPLLPTKESIQSLEQKVKDSPKDAESWALLGYSYISIGKNKAGVAAYNQARELEPTNVSLLIESASILAQLQNDQFRGEPIKLVNQALQLDENNVEALWRLGLYQYQQNTIDLAIATWEHTLPLMPSQSKAKIALMKTLITVKEKHSGKTQKDETVKLTVNVDIDSIIIQDRLQSNDFIMIYVRAASGMPIPIAIEKMRLKDFSGKVTLSDNNSVMPSRLLSQADKIIAVARITKTGQAIKQAGDIEVRSQPFSLKNTATISLNIK